MDSTIIEDKVNLKKDEVISDVIKEKNVTTSLLGHLKQWYNLKEVIEIQEECNE